MPPPQGRPRPMHPGQQVHMGSHGRSVIQYGMNRTEQKKDEIGDLLRDTEIYFKHQGFVNGIYKLFIGLRI